MNQARITQWLGYAGLLPFCFLSVMAWWAPESSKAFALQALSAYGACIASFLGAIHWGLAMRETSTASPWQIVWGVIPSLIAWVALLLPPATGLITLAMLLLLCLRVDTIYYPKHAVTHWLTMRWRLTTVASLSLLSAAAAAWN